MKIQINDNTPKQIQRIMDLDQLLNKWVCGTLELDKQERDKIETERNGLLMALAEQVELQIKMIERV